MVLTAAALLLSGCSALETVGAGCAPGSKPGRAGDTVGPLYNVHTPDDYDPTRRYPLIVVYPGLGETKDTDEPKTQLLGPATEKGYVIVFTGHYSPDNGNQVVAASRVPVSVGERWCIDPEQVFLVGNSDGATTLSEIVLDKLLDPPPAAIVVNAVGTSATYLEEQARTQGPSRCLARMGFMSIHGSNDQLFKIPDYGVKVADFWAQCHGCVSPLPETPDDTSCYEYSGCQAGGATIYCQNAFEHGVWDVDHNDRILAFIERF